MISRSHGELDICADHMSNCTYTLIGHRRSEYLLLLHGHVNTVVEYDGNSR